ncbi:MAG: transposase, partial [Hyphomonadaceae bacterium]|nr:transposase [Hyphomonadaceae bacterium]
MDFFTGLLSERVASDNVLRKVGALIDWRRVGLKVGKVRSQLGRSGYDVDLMLRVLLLGQWHSLSDRKLEEALRVRLDFMLFCGASLFEHVPDHTTICRFRCALVRLGLFDAVLNEVNRQLSAHGLKVEHAAVAVVDATVIESAGRPRRLIEGIAVDRAEEAVEGAAGGVVTECLSADPDGRWLKKGRNLHFGYKGFWRSDG